jgi:alpha-1,4-glucan:alpha-1,4-glucan 6-glycosyltransferase
VHLGSWRRGAQGERLSYRDLAPLLAEHCKRLGFTHVELLPITEHPFDASWGYQVSGYHAPTARHGDPDDFRFLVDHLHAAGLGVILDWVPGHFVKDDFGLLRYDGTPLFEHADPKRGEHPDWGTAIFNLARHEVRSFLLGNALWWLEELHLDGLRVDAVASMLYLDYSRREGEWIPNPHGGRENLEAVDFLRGLNRLVRDEQPGCVTIAEESTAWPGVTAPVEHGGLGFTFKWNMGWMHDTLAYFMRDPAHRRFHHDQLTFAMLYEHDERFVNALSHDELVHGKRSLIDKMPGDEWQRFANLRTLLAYQWTRPGKKLLFMGSEIASPHEWRHDESLPWHLVDGAPRAGLLRCVAALGALYAARPALWRDDPSGDGFRWIDCHDRTHSIISWERRAGDDHVVVLMNLTPVPRPGYRVGAPARARYEVALDTDDTRFGGSGYRRAHDVEAEPIPWQGRDQSLVLDLPPLSALVLVPVARPAPDPVEELADRLGIESEYHDVSGARHVTSDATRQALMAALGHRVADEAQARRALEHVRDLSGEASEARCVGVGEALGGQRAVGVTLNAWSIWRREGWGVGDLTDLALVAEWAASRGADFVGTGPLHLLPLDGSAISPYFPSSRRALHPLYLDVTAIPEWDSSKAARDLAASAGFQARLEAVRCAPHVDHAGALALKLEALEPLHSEFMRRHEGKATDRGHAHEAFVVEGGDALREIATHLAGSERLAVAGEVQTRVRFHLFVQFEIDRQLGEAQRRARAAGMRLGLMGDLAVGCAPDGADVRREPKLFATGASLGAPPDPLGPLGQDWSLQPIDPFALSAQGFAAWREILRAAMRHAGALRVDHVFGLMRQFWIPRGRPAREGAYVRQPAEALFGILAEESRRAGVLIVGEDLGTRPPGFDDVLRRFNVLSTRLLLFEREHDGTFLQPSQQHHRALLAFATHDLPPLRGWWAGRDIELRDALGLFDTPAARAATQDERVRDRERLLLALREQDLLPAAEPSPKQLAHAVHAYALRSHSPLIGLQLDDLVGETEPVNIPGTSPDVHPSWTRRQRISVDALRDDPFARAAWPARA